MAKKVAPLSPEAVAVFNAMREAGKALTMEEVKALGINANPAHFTALKNRGYITSEQVEKEVVTVQKRKINEYTVVADAVITE